MKIIAIRKLNPGRFTLKSFLFVTLFVYNRERGICNNHWLGCFDPESHGYIKFEGLWNYLQNKLKLSRNKNGKLYVVL